VASTDDLLRASHLELNHLNSDFEALLGGANLPLILLGTDLRVRRMTPLAQKLLGLELPDIGRKIGDLDLNMVLPDLATVVTEVLQTRRAIQREVQDRSGRWFSLSVRPCQSTGDSINGAVLTLIDIDALKRSEDEVKAARGLTQTVVDRVSNPLVVLNSDLRVQAVNQAYSQQFQVPVPDMTGAPLFGLRKGQWTSQRVRSWLEETLRHDQPAGQIEIEDDFPKVGRKRMALNARRFPDHSGEPGRILLIVREISAGTPATNSSNQNSAALLAGAESSP
jgi:two-component system CheB/CheR fusion protein